MPGRTESHKVRAPGLESEYWVNETVGVRKGFVRLDTQREPGCAGQYRAAGLPYGLQNPLVRDGKTNDDSVTNGSRVTMKATAASSRSQFLSCF
jgi:hypothetical protein